MSTNTINSAVPSAVTNSVNIIDIIKPKSLPLLSRYRKSKTIAKIAKIMIMVIYLV